MSFLTNHKITLLVFAFLLTVLTGFWVSSYSNHLLTTGAPLKIVSLELAWTEQNARCIAASWDSSQTAIAISSIDADFAFIFSYVLLLMLAVFIAYPATPFSRKTKLFLLLAFSSGVLDVIENVYMKSFLRGDHVSAVSFSLPASLKFILILVIIIYLLYTLYLFFRHKLAVVSYTLMAVRLFAAGLIAVIVCYFVFTNLSPGHDILIQITEFSGPFSFSLVCIILFTLFTWYSARLVGYEKARQPTNTIPVDYLIHFPRLIAFNGIVSIQAAILSLPTIANLTEWRIWVFVILQNALYFLWTNWLNKKSFPSLLAAGILTAGYIIWIVLLIAGSHCEHHQLLLPLIALLLFMFELLAVWAFIMRRRKIDKQSEDTLDRSQEGNLLFIKKQMVKLPGWLEKAEQGYFTLFNICAAVGIAIYITGFFSLWLADHIGPLAFTLLALGILVGLFNIIAVLSMRKKTNVFLLLFLLALLVGKFYNPYKVRLAECNNEDKRPQLLAYFTKWVEARSTLIDTAENSQPFPVYLVIADGGASRSGYWVASVLSALQDSTINEKKKSDSVTLFSDHLFCLAGASGGSVGNAAFYALLTNKSKNDTHTFLDDSRNFLKQDFLTPVITRWLGSDFIQHFVPLPFLGDRAAALEKSMERFSKLHLKDTFGKPYTDIIDNSGQWPILFINSTHMQSGSPAAVSSICLDEFSKRVDIVDYVSAQNKSTLRYSTAVVLGARFPYVSPAGYIGNDYFVDGGYFDNTGAGIVHEMMQEIDSVITAKKQAGNKRDLIYTKLRFTLIYLKNSDLKQHPRESVHALTNDIATPILTVLGTYSSQTSINNERLINFMKRINPEKPYYEINLYETADDPEYPMNWVISNYNLTRMDKRLERAKKTLHAIGQ